MWILAAMAVLALGGLIYVAYVDDSGVPPVCYTGQ
jgi:hypothetical protein